MWMQKILQWDRTESCVVYVGVGDGSCVIEQVAGQAAVWCGMLVLNSRIVLMYEQ